MNPTTVSCREIVFHIIRTQATHPVLIDGAEVGRGIFYPEVVAAVGDQMSPSTVRFMLGTLYHRGVINKVMLPGEGPVRSFRERRRPPTLYWTDPEWSEEDPRYQKLTMTISTPSSGVRGRGRSTYRPEGSQGFSYARQPKAIPSFTRQPSQDAVDAREDRLRRRADVWAVEDGTEEDPTLDWFDRFGFPFRTTPRRNPFGHGSPDDLRRVRWYVARMNTRGYGGPEYEKTRVRNLRRRFRTGK